MPPITIVCFKWFDNSGRKLLPRALKGYLGNHVNILYNMIWRNIKIPFRFVCITDDPAGIDSRIEIIPLWDKCRYLGGCFNRLYVFSEDMKKLLGPRFVCIDLDCVIVGDITDILQRQEDFVINSYSPYPATITIKNQKYNGGLFMMNAGCREQVWNSFDHKTSPDILSKSRSLVGTDQAWIRYVLGKEEKTFTREDGIYEARSFQGAPLPSNAKIVFFAGKRDPSLSRYKWVLKHWC